MNDSIIRRLTALEAKCNDRIPTFEEFKELWGTMDELSKSLYQFDAEYVSPNDTKFTRTIAEYLRRMGIVTGNPKDIKDIAREMEQENE